MATHLSYSGTPYADEALVEELITELGVTHIRDGWPADDVGLAERALALADRGVRITFVHDPREGGSPAEQHARVRDNLVEAVEAAESLNEPDRSGGDWAARSIEWTRALSEAYRGDSRTDHVLLLAPSIAKTNDRGAHRALADLKGVVDRGNTHDYPGKDVVMSTKIIDTVLRNQAEIVGDAPVIATETGYSDGPGDAPYEVVSQEEIAVLLPGLFLEHFRRGIARTFAYELLDEGTGRSFEDNFGLVEHDGTPKPSFVALRNMIGLLAAPAVECGQPDFVFSVEDGDEHLRSLVLRGGEDQYFLALWRQERPGSRPDSAVRVTVDNAVDEVRHFRPTQDQRPVRITAGGEIEVEVSSAVTFLEVNGVRGVPSPPSSGNATAPDR